MVYKILYSNLFQRKPKKKKNLICSSLFLSHFHLPISVNIIRSEVKCVVPACLRFIIKSNKINIFKFDLVSTRFYTVFALCIVYTPNEEKKEKKETKSKLNCLFSRRDM